MSKSNYNLNRNDIEIAFYQITENLSNKKWWKNKKAQIKAINNYNKLRLQEHFEQSRSDSNQYADKFLSVLKIWCKRCLDTEHWKKLKKSLKKNINLQEIQQKNEITFESQLTSIHLTQDACHLLTDAADKAGLSVSNFIINLLDRPQASDTVITKSTCDSTSGTEESIEEKTTEQKELKFEPIENKEVIAEQLKNYSVIDKAGQATIELWHLAGGQCQCMSKITNKRCKKISPNLAIKKRIIDGICYEYAVCNTHNKLATRIDNSFIRNIE